MIKSLLTFSMLTLFLHVSAQNIIPCITDEIRKREVLKSPELIKIEEEANLATLKHEVNILSKAGQIRYIPVVFHVLHNGGVENISQAQIMDQIRILNEDFRKKAGTNGGKSTNPLAADVEFEFRLAQFDPSGKKHDGINRFKTPLTISAGDNVKNVTFAEGRSYWDSDKYLNVWVVSSIDTTMGSGEGLVLGYAQFPMDRDMRPTTDGIVIRADQVGTVGIGQFMQAGRTLTHEVGHWMGLYHTFQGGCGNSSSNCNNQGDRVCDTPPVSGASFGCNKNKNSCSTETPDERDQIENYMDYADGNCMELFTSGQKTRMHTQMSLYRSILYNNAVQYAGINPSTGNYNVFPPSNIKANVFYEFENMNPEASGLRFNNHGNPSNGWQLNTTVGYNSNASLYMRNFTNNLAVINSRDGFQTPEIDLTQIPSPTLEFDYAYAQRNTATSDSLIVTISNTFGTSETRVYGNFGQALSTLGTPRDFEFIPDGPHEWKRITVLLNPYKTYTNARFRFDFLNRRGNNIFIDNIYVYNRYPTSLEESLKESVSFNVSPNPMNGTSTISYHLDQSAHVQISLNDVLGRKIKSVENAVLQSGSYHQTFNKDNMPAGIYYLHFELDEKRFTHKILVN